MRMGMGMGMGIGNGKRELRMMKRIGWGDVGELLAFVK